MTTVTEDFNPQKIQVGEAGLSSSLSGGPPFTIHGVAIAAGDITRGLSGDLKKWPGDTLKDATESLKGKNLVVHHENTVYSVVGEVIEARYQNNEVQFKAELDDEKVAERVDNGRLDVSARILHRNVDELEQDEKGAYVVDIAQFDNLSFVLKPGASPSNDVQMGASASMSAAELSGTFESDEEVVEEPDEDPKEEVENESDEQNPTGYYTIPVDDASL